LEIIMYDHIGLKVGNIDASVRFYTAALAPLGYVLCSRDEGGAGFGPKGEPALWLYLHKGPAAAGAHIAFRAPVISESNDGACSHTRLAGRRHCGRRAWRSELAFLVQFRPNRRKCGDDLEFRPHLGSAYFSVLRLLPYRLARGPKGGLHIRELAGRLWAATHPHRATEYRPAIGNGRARLDSPRLCHGVDCCPDECAGPRALGMGAIGGCD